MSCHDVLILGGGTAGCVLASRLSEDPGREVCLVEGGPDYGPRRSGRWPPELVDVRGIASTHDWTDAGGSLQVARVIGGCSAHNLGFWVHPARADWDEWVAATGDDGWSADAIAPAIRRVEERMPLRLASGSDVNPWLATLMEAAEEVGLPSGPDVNELDEGVAPVPLNADGTTRWNAAFAYLDEARGRPNLTIVDRALVDRVHLDGDRAAGAVVQTENGQESITAALVVVASGAYGSPAILLRSGIGPAEELRRHGVEQRAELPVGTRLRDHIAVRFRLAPSDSMQTRIEEFEARAEGFVVQGLLKGRSSHCPEGLWDLHGVILAIPAADGGFPERGGHVLGLSSSLVKPRWTGTVRLRSADPATLPEVTPHGFGTEPDMRCVLDGLELCRRLAEAPAARDAWTEQLAPDPALDEDGLRRYCDGNALPYFHPVGTCAMGRPDDGVSTVDGSGRVHGIEGLRVVVASIMPAIPRANTNMPTFVLAERIAESA